ncbi:MAG: hypothetical protein RLZZ458_2591, partial [Planctomycetota bacterium]
MNDNQSVVTSHLNLQRVCAVALVALVSSGRAGLAVADEPDHLSFDVVAEPAIRELSPEFCWFHSPAAAIPELAWGRPSRNTTANESWGTDAKFISRPVDPDAGKRPHPKGADRTVWVGHVTWSNPSLLAMTSGGGIPQPVVNAPRARSAGVKRIVTVSQSTPELPRRSEGDVIELNDGRLLLVSMEFGGDGSDFAATRFVSHESSDGGHSWGQHRVITETLKGDLNVYSPNLIRAKDGGILLLFMRQHRPGLLTNHVWKSTDEGNTFSPYAEFVPKRDFALCNATVKRLA